jgi:hypothetical protein
MISQGSGGEDTRGHISPTGMEFAQRNPEVDVFILARLSHPNLTGDLAMKNGAHAYLVKPRLQRMS